MQVQRGPGDRLRTGPEIARPTAMCVQHRAGETTKARLGQPVLGSRASGAKTKRTPTFPAQKAMGMARKAIQEDLVGLWDGT